MAGINAELFMGSNGRLVGSFLAAGAVVKNALVVLSADDTVSATTANDSELVIGKAIFAISAADVTAGKTVDIELFGRAVVELLAGGTVTRGLRQTPVGTAGKITNVGASPDPGAVIGIAMKSGVDGDVIPVLI